MTAQKKGIVFILDGLGDRPCQALEGKTPLEAAVTPNLDKLAKFGQNGLMDPIMAGLPVDTHTGVGILFGLPPKQAARLNRGPIEAAGINLPMKTGDVLFRANIATLKRLDNEYHILDRRAGRINEDVAAICELLQNIEVGENIFASLHPATQHRCVLQLTGPELSDEISDTDPGGKEAPILVQSCIALDQSNRAGTRTAQAVNEFTRVAYQLLQQHPINEKRKQEQLLPGNGVITRGAGFHQDHSNLINHLGLRAAVVAGESTILGLGNLFDYSVFTDERFTSLPDTNLDLKLKRASNALETHDLVYVHIKGTDTAAHDKDPILKADFISRFDQALDKVDFGDRIVAVCADHSTDSIRGEHNGDAVPVLIHHQSGRIDLVTEFNETSCTMGALNRLTAQSFLTSVLDAMGCLPNANPASMKYF